MYVAVLLLLCRDPDFIHVTSEAGLFLVISVLTGIDTVNLYPGKTSHSGFHKYNLISDLLIPAPPTVLSTAYYTKITDHTQTYKQRSRAFG